MPRSPTHEAARAYAARGWHVFPIDDVRPGDPKSGKNPKALLAPNGWHDATTDVARIDEWWGRFPHLGVGIALEPSGLVVLDVDSRGFNRDGTPKEGAKSLAALEAEIGELGPTRVAETGSGGHHGFFLRDAFPLDGSKIGFLKNLDLIVNGYVVAAPSPHYTGGTYKWIDERPPAILPRALVERAGKSRVKTIAGVPDATREKVGEGGRNASMFRLACSLRDTGLGTDALRAAMALENQARFDPPMDDAEVAEIAEKVIARVVPSRDVALGAVVAEEARAIAQKLADDAARVEDASRVALPPLAAEVAAKPHRAVRYFETGVAALDERLNGGLPDSEVCGVVGPPSCGKSAFVGCLADVMSRNMPLVHVSTELTTHELVDRYAALRGELVWKQVRAGVIPRARVLELVRGLNVYVIGCDDLFGDAGPGGMPDPIGHVFGIAARVGDRLGAAPGVVIDHMGVFVAGASEDSVRQRAGELTMKVRVLTQALRTVSICVYPTQRNMYGASGTLERLRQSDDPSVFLAAAKESGDIEYHCATILYTDVDKAVPGPLKPARIVVARSRQGDPGFVGMRAKLDVGKWWGDPSALAEMSGMEAQARTNRERDDVVSLRLFDVIARNPGRRWTEILSMVGLSKDRVNAARGRLLDAGRIQMLVRDDFNALGRPTKVETWIAVANKEQRGGVDQG